MTAAAEVPERSTAVQRLLHGSRAVADIDEAFADAIGAAAVLVGLRAVDGVDEQAPALAGAACIELLAAVRRGELDMPDRRTCADRWLEVLLRCVPVDVRLRPLAQLLVYLADDPSTTDPSRTAPHGTESEPVDACFELAEAASTGSSARIDQLIDRTRAGDASARRPLLDELSHHEVIVPVVAMRVTDDGVDLVFATVRRHGVPHVAAFTTPERFAEFARASGHDESRSLAAARAELVRVLPPGHALILNPGSVTSASLTESEVRTGRLGPALVGDPDLTVRRLEDPSIESVVEEVTGVVACHLAEVDDNLVVVVGVADDYEDETEVLAEVGGALSSAGLIDGIVVDRRTPIGRSVLAVHPPD